MKFSHFMVWIAGALFVCACSKKEAGDGAAGTTTQQASAQGAEMHAPAAAKPGSHEDWCGEHAVPESMCTRCNSALIPAFKATGDWCPEHGLPESQCTLCNPGLKIERPPKGS